MGKQRNDYRRTDSKRDVRGKQRDMARKSARRVKFAIQGR